jgi:hypothetical protein
MDNATIDNVVLSVLAFIVFFSLWLHATRMDRKEAVRPAAPAPAPALLTFAAPVPELAPKPMLPALASDEMASMPAPAQPAQFRAELKRYLWLFGKFVLILYAAKAALIGIVWVMSPEDLVPAGIRVIGFASFAIAAIFVSLDRMDVFKMKSRRPG